MHPNLRAGSAAVAVAMLVLVAYSSDTKRAVAAPIAIEIFMRVDADHAEVKKVDSMLRHSPVVVQMRFLNHVAAFREFRCMFRDQSDLTSGISYTDVPESFRVTLRRAPKTLARCGRV